MFYISQKNIDTIYISINKMGFTYGADGSLIRNRQNQSGELSHEHFDIQKQIESFENVATNAINHKEHFQNINEAQNRQINEFENHLKTYENFIQNKEAEYGNVLNEQAEQYSNYIRTQENMCGSKINQHNNLLAQQQNILQKQQGAIEYFNNLNEAQNNTNMKIAEYYQNLSNSYPEYFTIE
jgi:hypothetical protein